MSTRAQTIYGAPLPPEWEGSTKGELRVRVDKLLLDDDAINRNPLVKLFKGNVATGNETDGVTTGHRTRATPSSSRHAGLVSPNRFVVPVDYCEVSPLFWGETHPSCHCQPATPGKSTRGAVSLVYPIKSTETEFVNYLANMTASPHHGMQLEIYVPSSYSGRPPVHVGKSVVCLDTLQPGTPIAGWFTVAHYQRTVEGHADPQRPLFVPVGKVKLHIQVSYFSDGRGTPALSTAGRASHGSRNVSCDIAVEENSHVAGHTVSDTHEDGSSRTERPLPSTADNTQMPDAHTQLPEATVTTVSTLPSQSTIAHVSAGETVPESGYQGSQSGKSIRLQEVLRQGMALQAKMSMAVDEHLRNDESEGGGTAPHHSTSERSSSAANAGARSDKVVSSSPPVASASRASSSFAGASQHNESEPAERCGVSKAAATPVAATVDDEPQDSSNDSLFTSEASEEERALLETQQQRQQRESLSAAVPLASQAPPPLTTAAMVANAQTLTPSSRPPRLGANAQTAVDLVFSDISFASTPVTADLAEVRLQVRLSSDITTQTPASGPFSSYIHQLPLSQATICLSFNVCGYSEETSKLVVEVFKVLSRPRVVAGSTLLPPTANAVREVIGEELLGLAIVGLYRQSRDVVLRDPVLDVSHLYAHLQVYLNGSDMEDDATTAAVHQGVPTQHDRGETEATAVRGGCVAGTICGDRVDNAAPADAVERRSSSTPHSSAHRSGRAVDENGEDRQHAPLGTSPQSLPLSTHPSPTTSDRDQSLCTSRQLQQTGDMRRPSAPPPLSSPHVAVTYVAADEAQAAAAGIPMISPSSVHGRCRVHLAIHGAKHVPRVKVTPLKASAGHGGLALSRLEDSSLSDDELVRHGFSLPNTFFVVEEVLSGVDHGQPRTAPVAEWFVEKAVKGHFDRTHVIFQSCDPTYAYESILSLPAEGVFLKQENHSHEAEPAAAMGQRARPCLRELVLTLWHYADAHAADVPAGDSLESERAFWSKVAYVGECRIDLRSLRHMDSLNGYYRVLFTPTPTAVRADTVSSAKLDYTDADKTIGYVHVSVSLLDR